MTPLDLIETCNVEIKENVSYNKRIEKAQASMLKRFDFDNTIRFHEWCIRKLENI